MLWSNFLIDLILIRRTKQSL